MGLPDYPFKSNFITVEGISIHYLDEGPHDAPVILFLHGVPTWSFLFRNIIPDVVKAGYRVVSPDLPGMGYSEKPREKEFYSLRNMIRILDAFISSMGLKKACLFTHDWGTIYGMVMVAQNPELYPGIIVCNGLLPDLNMKLPRAFYLWKIFTKYSPWLPVGEIINLGSSRRLNREERMAYNAPFSSRKEKSALRILPQLIPFKGADSKMSTDSWNKLEKCITPFLTIFSDNDPITRNGEKIIQERIPGARNQAHKIVSGRHFLMEDAPAELAAIAIEFFTNLHEERV